MKEDTWAGAGSQEPCLLYGEAASLAQSARSRGSGTGDDTEQLEGIIQDKTDGGKRQRGESRGVVWG